MASELVKLYENNGFIEFNNIFEDKQIEKWNKILDPYFSGKDEKVRLDLTSIGKDGHDILKEFFNDKVKFITNELIKDPIVFYAGSIEIPSNSKISHVNHNEIGGWHTGTGENLQYLDLRKPIWMTFFVYLTDVGQNDGPFEITNKIYRKEINHNTKAFSLLGNKGKCFLWGNTFYHRAAPNLGNKRRRILKIQVQHNYLENSYTEQLKKFHKYINEEENYFKYLTGFSHHSTYRDWKLEHEISKQEIDIVKTDYNKNSNKVIQFSYTRRIKDKIKNFFNVNKI